MPLRTRGRGAAVGDISGTSLASGGATALAARLRDRPRRPALGDESRDLRSEPIRPEAQLEDVRRLDETRMRELAGEHAGVGEGMHRVDVMPDDQRRHGQLTPLRAVRGDVTEEQALEQRGARTGVLTNHVKRDVAPEGDEAPRDF